MLNAHPRYLRRKYSISDIAEQEPGMMAPSSFESAEMIQS
jgi:hypothetical protein